MNKFKKWIDGFRKKEYVVPLATEANLSSINLDIMGSIFESMSRTIAHFTCESASFSIIDFKATKLVGNLVLMYNLLKKKEPISQLKISRCGLDISQKREIYVSATVFCLGIDKEVWRFDFKASSVYTSLNNEIEFRIADVLIEYINGFIQSIQLSKMCQCDVIIQNTTNYDSVHGEMYSGWVRSYCNNIEYPYYASIHDATDMTNDAVILLHCVNEEEMEEQMEDDSMIIDVIRRRNTSMMLQDDIDLSDVPFSPCLFSMCSTCLASIATLNPSTLIPVMF